MDWRWQAVQNLELCADGFYGWSHTAFIYNIKLLKYNESD
jgi:hypothetical protein